MKTNYLSDLNSLAAKILGFAVIELYPDARLIEGKKNPLGFYYELYFPYEINDEMISLIEEKMKFIIKEKFEIKYLSMLSTNAFEYLNHLKRHKNIDSLKNTKELIDLIRIEDFVDIGKCPLKNTSNLEFFKLIKISKKDNNILRIDGIASNSKKDLIDRVKRYKKYKKYSHVIHGEEKELFLISNQDVIFLSKGIKLKNKIIGFWEKYIKKDGFEIVETPNDNKLFSHYKILEKMQQNMPVKLAEIEYKESLNSFFDPLFVSKEYTSLKEYIYCSSAQSQNIINSSLQFIFEVLNILNLKYEVALITNTKDKLLKNALKANGISYVTEIDDIRVPVIEFRLEDFLKRKWRGPYIKACLLKNYKLSYTEKKPCMLISRSIIGSVERLLAIVEELDIKDIFENNNA